MFFVLLQPSTSDFGSLDTTYFQDVFIFLRSLNFQWYPIRRLKIYIPKYCSWWCFINNNFISLKNPSGWWDMEVSSPPRSHFWNLLGAINSLFEPVHTGLFPDFNWAPLKWMVGWVLPISWSLGRIPSYQTKNLFHWSLVATICKKKGHSCPHPEPQWSNQTSLIWPIYIPKDNCHLTQLIKQCKETQTNMALHHTNS